MITLDALKAMKDEWPHERQQKRDAFHAALSERVTRLYGAMLHDNPAAIHTLTEEIAEAAKLIDEQYGQEPEAAAECEHRGARRPLHSADMCCMACGVAVVWSDHLGGWVAKGGAQ